MPETQDSSNKSVSGTVTVSETKQTTPSVPTEVNSNQKTQESNSKIQKTESSKSVDSSRISQDSKPKVQNIDSSKILYCMICKREDHRTSDHEMYTTSLKRSENYKAQPYLYASSSKQILRAKAKPFPPCTHCGFNDHRPNDCRNYSKYEICRSYDHSTSGHNHVIQIKEGVLAESSQSNESSIGVKCDTCGSIVHSTTGHNMFDHFKRGEKIQAAKAREPISKDPPDLINTEGTHEQKVQNDQMITQPTNVPSGNNTEVSGSITESLVPDVTQSHISNQASTSSYLVPQDRWSRDQHIELVNIIGDPGKGMLTRSMAAKLTTSSASECLFDDFLYEIEPKKEEGIDYDETITPVARMEAIRIFLAFATYMNLVYQMDVKSAFLNGKLKEEVYFKQPHSFEISEFSDYVCKLDKALHGLKQEPKACYKLCKQFEKLMTNKFEMGMMGGNGYLRKGQKQSHKRQNQARELKEHEAQVKIKAKSKSQKSTKVNPNKVKVKAKADIEEILNGPPVPI
ncbi:retrovirus-related pol polyprotein from transposon TNT 1-94 [Tanacetum coccineum]